MTLKNYRTMTDSFCTFVLNPFLGDRWHAQNDQRRHLYLVNHNPISFMSRLPAFSLVGSPTTIMARRYRAIDSKSLDRIQLNNSGLDFRKALEAIRNQESNAVEQTEGSQHFDILKADDDKRLVFGWANIAFTADGEQLEDLQRDIIDTEDLEEAVYNYVLNFRDGGEEHIPTMRKKASLVESVMFTKEKMKAMGIPEGIVPEGWWIGFYVSDDSAWARIKDGTYKMFSIEGKAIRIPVEDENIDKADRINGCGVLVVKDGKILTGTRIGGKHGNQICGPGGHIERGESHEEAAIREAREEFGIECKSLVSLGIQDGGRNYGKSAVFLCTEYDGEPKTDEEEMTDCKWRTIEELQEERLFKPFEHSLELITEEVPTEKSSPNYDEFPSYYMWLEENLDATIEEQKKAKEHYKNQKNVAKMFSDVIQKFNPFHDAKGRFASSNGFASYSANPKTKAGAMAIARSFKGGHGTTFNVHRESQGENINQNHAWLNGGPGAKALAAQGQLASQQPKTPPKAQNAAPQQPQKPATPPKPQKNYDSLGYADHDDADYHQLYNGRQYYQQQQLSATQKTAANNYLESQPEPYSLYSHSQNMNYMMATGQTLTGKYKQTHDGIMSSMHNLGYNLELTRYDHAGFVDGMLSAVGINKSYENMTQASLKKALVGQTVNEDKFLSCSYNGFKNAPQSSRQVFDSRAVEIKYKAKASTKAMMPGVGPGGDLGEIILAPTSGKSGCNAGGKIVDVKLTKKMVRRKGTQTYNQPRIEITIEI